MKQFNANFHKFSLSTFSTNFDPFSKAVCAEFLLLQIAFDICHKKEYNKGNLISFCNFTENLQKKDVSLCLLPSKILQNW